MNLMSNTTGPRPRPGRPRGPQSELDRRFPHGGSAQGKHSRPLNEVELDLIEQFQGKRTQTSLPSDVAAVGAARTELLLPDEQRGKMPLTKSQYIVKENEDLVMWERELRKFLRKLSPDHEHRISATMVYEWATGIPVTELFEAAAPTTDFRRLNKLLREYFGSPYTTWICGRKVKRAYTVPAGHYITRRAPKTLALWAEWHDGTLYP